MKNIQVDIIDKLTPEIIEDMKKIHFVADLHWGHPKIVPICNRPVNVPSFIINAITERNKDKENWSLFKDPDWKSNMNEYHDAWLIKEVWNSHINRKDEVYVLGDVSLQKRKDAEKTVARLNGNKHLILGNHDKSVEHLGNWSEITQIKDFTYSRFGLNIHIALCHYPMASWNRKPYGAWHLYGHVHGRFANAGMSIDVGIDNTDNIGGVFHWGRPVNLYEVCLIMNEKQKLGHDKYDSTEKSIDID